MNYPIELNERERELILNLLHREQRQLPVELHRADSMDVHRVLNERLNTLDRLILRLEEQTRIAVD
ncbi:MAG TPA: hypothetical protein VH518_10040 [Tepidisphaeraceae bacterium]|jgi:hypothetical protein